MQCAVCGVKFTPYRDTQQFCGGACRVKAHRAKRAGKPVTPDVTPREVRRPSGSAGVTPDVTALSDDELLVELQRRVNAEHNRLLDISERALAGDTVAGWEHLTKAEAAIARRFARDHEKYSELVIASMAMAAREWAQQETATITERNDKDRQEINARKKRIDALQDALQGQTVYRQLYALTTAQARKVRSFIHPDKHGQCGLADKAHAVSLIMEPVIEVMLEAEKLRKANGIK